MGGWRPGGPRLRLWDLRPQVSPAPAFAAAVALRPAEWGDEDGDDEIYFFFTETSRAFDSYEHIKVPRVARVCAVRLRPQLSVVSCSSWPVSFPLWVSVCASLLCLLFSYVFFSGSSRSVGKGSILFRPIITLVILCSLEVDYLKAGTVDRQTWASASPPLLTASVTLGMFSSILADEDINDA